MRIDPDIVAAGIIPAVVYPFAVFFLARRIAEGNNRKVYFLTFLNSAAIIGGVLAVAFLTTQPIFKYPIPNIVAGLVFMMAAAATGALLGAVLDRWGRMRFRGLR